MKLKNLNYKRIALHTLFWLCLVTYSAYYFGYPNQMQKWFFRSLSIVPVDIAYVYLTIYVLLPKLLLKKKYFIFALLFIFLGAANEILCNIIAKYIIRVPEFESEKIYSFTRKGAWDFFANYYFALLALAIKLARIWYRKNRETKLILKEKYTAEIKLKDAELKLKDAELRLLKAQVHPHFLFNTLNNLYGLTLENSRKAPEIVIKLSALLDYVLYKCNTPTVSLSNEVAQIINYIELEKIRYDENLSLIFDQEGDSENKRIAPLLLLPFVENCFKHGVSTSTKNSWINISISIIDNNLMFCAENSKTRNNQNNNSKYSEGIGLKNVKQRLALAYKNNHDLSIYDEEEKFSVNLKIKLEG